jgi:NifU-like protein involved in Fe-S cluster formation
VDELTGVILDAKFKTFGCGSAIASSSLATEWLKGRKIEDCLTIKVGYAMLGLGARVRICHARVRLGYAMLGLGYAMLGLGYAMLGLGAMLGIG